MRQVLKLQSYRRLLAAYTLTQLAWSVGTLALAVLVYRRTGSALGSTAFFLAAQFIPALVSPLLVARIDRLPPRRVLSTAYALEVLAFAALAWVSTNFALWAILVLAAADGIVAGAARAIIRSSTVAATSPLDLLREGNALLNTAFSICYFVGPALGAVIADAGGTSAALWLDAGLFALIAALLASSSLPGEPAHSSSRSRRLRAALRHAREQPAIRALLGLQIAGLLFFTISVPVEVVFAVHTLHSGRGGYAALLSCWGGGTVVGSAAYARWRGIAGYRMIALGAAGLGAGLLMMAAAPGLGLAIAGAVVAGAGNGVEAVAARTSLQEQVEPDWMAIIMSLNESLFQAVPGAGILLGGALTALAGTRVALAVAGAGATVIAAWAALWLPRRSPGRLPDASSASAAATR